MSGPRDRDRARGSTRPTRAAAGTSRSTSGDGGEPPTGGLTRQPADPRSRRPGSPRAGTCRRPAPRDRPGRAGPAAAAGRAVRERRRDEVFEYEGDHVGAQGWALQHGWTISDGEAPQDAVLRDLMATAPVRPGKEARPAACCAAGPARWSWSPSTSPIRWAATLVPKYAVTAAPLLGAVPVLRLSPARFWRHRTGGLVPVASGNEAFDTRWLLLAAEDGPQVRRLVQDPAVQGLLLGTDDGDEFWTGAGHLAAVRPDGHRPLLIEHHARLLTALVGALALGY